MIFYYLIGVKCEMKKNGGGWSLPPQQLNFFSLENLFKKKKKGIESKRKKLFTFFPFFSFNNKIMIVIYSILSRVLYLN